MTEKPAYPKYATAIRYCPQGEVAYVDFGAPEQTFPNRDEMWGRQVPTSKILDIRMTTRTAREQI